MITMLVDGVLKEMTIEQYNQYVASLRYGIRTDSDGRILGYKQKEYEIQDPNFPDDPTKKVVVNDLDKVVINGQEFRGIGYQGLMTVNTKTYVTEPTRANDGSIENINDYDTFVVPRCKVNFKYFSLDDYMRLCEAVTPNEFLVEYYDKQFNTRVSHLMYCEPEEMVKLYNVGTSVIGVLDYEISFIGTLNSRDPSKIFEIKYDANGGSIRNSRGQYASGIVYNKGDRVYRLDPNNNEEWYEAIYEKTSFSATAGTETWDSEPPNSTYWEIVAPSLYSDTTLYSLGSVVYTTYEENEQTKYRYYEAIKNNFRGYNPTNTTYWKSIGVSKYSTTRTYSKGDYCYKGNGNTPKSVDYYRAIYDVTSFTSSTDTGLDNASYWKLLPILRGDTREWGQSMILSDPTDLFIPPNSSLTSGDKWLINDPNGSNFYLPKQPINVFRNMTLYAQWVMLSQNEE